MKTAVLLVGGPGDGQLVDVALGTASILYTTPTSYNLTAEADPPVFGASYHRAVYNVIQLVLFNRIVYVAVHESISSEARCDAVARTMLSETGNLLRSQAEPLRKGTT